ncbi:hypothetical protein HHK36_014529 [Tetracentron sinense]|uniref:Uncharacterized protein n=1 Tax=Tetracentron sinense TaxID=13715 RepID=A0A835DFW2_TETSI|nr:hypothetical protein HHK36_014529 [Tetracentron sinense]
MAGSSSLTSHIVVPNITNLVSIKLDRDNYLLWKSQFVPILRTNKLLKYVDGSSQCPEQFLCDDNNKPMTNINLEYERWMEQDSLVLLWINATLTPTVLQRVIGLQSSREVWLRLERLHLIQSRSRVLQLKQQFQNLKKGGSSITDYLDKMKHIADALEAIGQPITEYDLCNQILNGLGQEYDPVHTSVVNRDTPINFEDLFGQLLTFEMRLDSHTTTPTLEQPSTAFFTNRSTHSRAQGRGGSRGSSYFRGRGRGRNHGGRANPSNNHSTKPSNAPSCQICNRVGHSALDCFHRLDLSFQGRQSPPKLQAMAAMRQDSTWFTDTGATNHVTADLNNLSLHSDYEGSDNLTVGNGKGLRIEHIGSTSYSSNGSTFHMQDILHVPCITKNLLSVSEFSKDNDCHFVFTSSGFSVKDNKSGKILFQGRSSKGLYPLHFQPHDKNKPYSSPSAFISSTVSSSVWHHRLGHPSHQTLQQVAPHIHLGRSSQHQTICSSCQMGKALGCLFNFLILFRNTLWNLCTRMTVRRKKKNLKIIAGSCYLPKDDELKPRGVDAHFIHKLQRVIVVADGVGGWAKRGVDLGEYARELMYNSIVAIHKEPYGFVDSERVLEAAYSNTKVEGSSTACLVAFTNKLRRFNCPYQLGSGSKSDPLSSAQGMRDGMEPGDVASVIAERALDASNQRYCLTPFSEASKKAGMEHIGGKYDDITVIVARIGTLEEYYIDHLC